MDPTQLPATTKSLTKGYVFSSLILSNAMEGWVKKVAGKSGQPVDWHFCGGRERVLALGDIAKVNQAIQELMPEHDALQDQQYISHGLTPPKR